MACRSSVDSIVFRCFSTIVAFATASGSVDPDQLAQCDSTAGSGMALLQTVSRGLGGRGTPNSDGYYWVQRGADPEKDSFAPYSAPVNFSRGPAWTWANKDDEQVRHSPLIDHEKNVYITTTLKLRKFDQDGAKLWEWRSEDGTMSAAPALYRGGVYLLSKESTHVTVHRVDMASGKVDWKKRVESQSGPEASSVFVEDDFCIIPLKNKDDLGTTKIHVMSAKDGKSLFDYELGELVWNFSPASPGDQTLLFSGSCGGAARISLKDEGREIWRVGATGKWFCSTGGGALGPNGVYYTEYTKPDQSAEISAYSIADGSLIWARNFPEYGGGQYPAVGRVGKDGRLAVVAAIGDQPGVLPQEIAANPVVHAAYLNSSYARRSFGAPQLKNAVVALDASSGDTLWIWREELWDHYAAAGDEGFEMVRRVVTKSVEGPICLPDLQGIPLISGNGYVYASSSHGGNLTVIRDENQDGIIQENETNAFAPGNAFLNSPSLAPNMLVAATCYGPVNVFKD